MKIPRRITEINERKQLFIDSRRDQLEKSVIKLQSDLLNRLLMEVIPELDTKDGMILDTTKNYRILTGLDKVYKDFTLSSLSTILSEVSVSTTGILKIGKTYYNAILSDELKSTFGKIVDATANKMNLRIGLNGGNIVSGGFLESIIKDSSTGSQIKNFVSKSVTGQSETKEFIKGLSSLVTGQDKPGLLEKQYERYAYDLYQQYDSAYNGSIAEQLGLRYFLYQGGLVGDSRDFCAAHNDKVWSIEEADTWKDWTPSKGEYPPDYKVKQKSIYEVPSYLGYPGYQPLIDRGGYRCRHSISFISDELAQDLRPDLK
jgi:hypothetical protein